MNDKTLQFDNLCKIKVIQKKKIKQLEKQLSDLQEKYDKAVKIIRKFSLTGDGTHSSKHSSFYDCLPTLQLEFDERVEYAREFLKLIEGKNEYYNRKR